MEKLVLILSMVFLAQTISAGEYHVSKKGSDTNTGSVSSPFNTIMVAAQKAQPGDVITVDESFF